MIWVIAYINRDFLSSVDLEIKRYGYNVQAYIPTVKIIKKRFRGKNEFEMVPLLFNYGFFRVSFKDACNPEFLLMLRSRISCIYGWVHDPIKSMKNLSIKANNAGISEALPGTAFATDYEISQLVKHSNDDEIYSAEEVIRFKKGDYIKLKGYPFDDVDAEILSINKGKKEVRVKLLLDAIVKEATVSFSNVFYTVFSGYDDALTKGVNLDELGTHSTDVVDKLLYKNGHYE